MSYKLKPCPFCGCEYTKDDDDYWWAGEHERGCPLSARFPGGGCNVTVFDEKEDIDAWNKRAVDAVEVVRCKDCKHRGFAGECPMCYTEDAYDEDYGYDYWDVDKTVDEGFCHCGEKWDTEVIDDA